MSDKGKTQWRECATCVTAKETPQGFVCTLDNPDSISAEERPQEAAKRGNCMTYQPNNPIAALNALPDEVKPMGEEAAPMVDPMEKPLWEIDSIFLNPFAELPEVETWTKMGERNAIDRQGIITFSAKPKQGKSLSIYALLLAIISGRRFDTLTPTAAPRLVVVFDTEMDAPTLQKRAKKMQAALGNNGKRFQIVSLLQIPKKNRRAVVDEVTAKYNPDIVVIDQVARMVEDFNAAAECVDFGEWLAQYAATRTTMVVIHQNKAADNKQMKGHLGSILEELAVENYGVEHSNGVFAVTPTNARNSCVEDAAKFTFALDTSGNIVDASAIVMQKQKEDWEKWHKDFEILFGNDEEVRSTELERRILKQLNIDEKQRSKATDKISNAVKAGAIRKQSADHRAPYILTSCFEPLQ